MDIESYRKILTMAVQGEVEAHSFYKGVADKAKNAQLQMLFNELAGEESKHRTMLEGFLAKPPDSLKFEASQDYKIGETLDIPKLSVNLKPLEGITLAIRKELDAMQMYTQLANRSTDPGQKKIFSELASMERGHKARLEDIYTNMAFPEAW